MQLAPGRDGAADGGMASTRDPDAERALAKVGRRIIPLFMLIAMANHMDRSK